MSVTEEIKEKEQLFNMPEIAKLEKIFFWYHREIRRQ